MIASQEIDLVFQEESHTYKWRGKPYPSVTQILTATLGDPFAGVPPEIMAAAQNRGNMVHLGAFLLTDGDLDWKSVHPKIEGYIRAVERFHKECPGKIVYTEKRMVCPALGLAGTPDLCMFIRGRRALVDYKTSQNMMPRMRLQTAGYAVLHNALFPTQPIYERYGLRLQPDGYYKLIQHTDEDDISNFHRLFARYKATEMAASAVAKYA